MDPEKEIGERKPVSACRTELQICPLVVASKAHFRLVVGSLPFLRPERAPQLGRRTNEPECSAGHLYCQRA